MENDDCQLEEKIYINKEITNDVFHLHILKKVGLGINHSWRSIGDILRGILRWVWPGYCLQLKWKINSLQIINWPEQVREIIKEMDLN